MGPGSLGVALAGPGELGGGNFYITVGWLSLLWTTGWIIAHVAKRI